MDIINENTYMINEISNNDYLVSFKKFICNISSPLLNLNNQLLNEFEANINSKINTDLLIKFSNNADISVIYIEAPSIGYPGGLSLNIDGKLQTSCISILKTKDNQLDPFKTISSQVQVSTVVVGSEIDNNIDGNRAFFMLLQQYTKHLYAPIIRSCFQISQLNEENTSENENITILQRKIRELDVVLEQCQRGTMIPKIILPVPSQLNEIANLTNSITLKGHLEKYNASQVDQLFDEIKLTQILGKTQEEKEEFANIVNKSAKQWPSEIAKQTRQATESSFPGSAEAEIEFWKDLDRKLADTKEQLESGPIVLTKLVLKRTNRVSEQLIRESEVELDKAIELVQVSVSFLRDFPIAELMSATDLHPKLTQTVSSCLQHFSKLKHSRYDFYRASSLLEVLGSAVSIRILTLLKEKSIMQCTFEEFRKVKNHSDEVFSAWDTHLASQRSMLKDVAKRRNITKQKNFRFDLDILQQRLKEIFEFREQHERLLNVFLQVLSGQEGTVISELNEAYALVLRSENDVLDITPAGTVVWKNSRQLYERRLEKTEDHITKLLEEQLSASITADDMFRVFATFNPLFFRPAIRTAVNSFRTVLLKNVREDVKRLQEKFRLRYDDSLERASADLRDIPPLCGRIIWARQIENQLTTLMKRMEDVLGVAWEDHFEGKQLKEVCDELKNYLDTNQLYTDWLNLQLESNMQKYNKLKDFLLLVEDDPRTSQKILKVNFDEKQVIVFKEVSYLEWLLPGMTTAHKTIPTTIRSQSKEAYTRYPVAMALQAALSGFYQANSGINEGNSILLVSHLLVVRELVKEALGGSKRSRKWIKWDSSDLSDWVGQLSNKVFALEERVVDVNETLKTVGELLLLLKSCPYDRNKFEEILLQLQGIVDNLQIRGFSNIHVWINNLDDKIENILTDRLKSACIVWVNSFNSDNNNDINNNQVNSLALDQTVHEILLSNQMLYLSPPIEQARTEWIANFHNYIDIVVTLPRIVGSRFKVFENVNDSSLDYSSILLKLGSDVVKPPFVAIENKLALANDYIQSWLQYQALWDTSVATVAEKIGNDLIKWQQLLNEIKFARNTIDSVDDEKLFGPIIINHRQVLNKVNLKYDIWQKELQARFGNILSDVIKSTHTDLVTCKTRLEAIYLEGPTKDVIMGVEFILKTRSIMKDRKELVSNLESSEKLLQKQRYQFPNDWLSVANVSSSLKDLIQIFERRVTAMDIQLSLLQTKVREEDKDISIRTDELLSNWDKMRPVIGGKIPSEMIQNLSMMSSQVSKLSEDTSRILGAKEALGLEFLPDNRLEYIMQEIKDLREVWTAVLPIYDRLQVIRSVLLRDTVPTTNRKDLEELINELKNLSSKIRGYAAVEFIKDELTKYNNVYPLLKDLCSETLKDRHWKLILTSMGIKQSYSSLTIGSLWDTSPMTYRKSISEILSTAQGELAIDQFLRDIRENWISSELNLVLRDGIRLIVGWDILFSTLEDNLNSLASLKQSPYFRNVPEFQEDTANWELRLTNLRGIFDIWVEVQRKWVYLRGIFKNPDIKAQLPSQFSKFKSVDNEFMALMKKVTTKPLVMDLLQLDNLTRQLERQDTTMTLIQKALGEYLEKQRQMFPRFYFVNNDDLVEIIGNSNEPSKIVTHIGKMFSSMTTLEMTIPTNVDDIKAGVLMNANIMCSKEGECVKLLTPVRISIAVKEWLIQLELQMAVTLASLLQEAYNSSVVENKSLLAWIDKYPAQIIILSSQISWTQNTEKSLLDKEVEKTLLSCQITLENRLKSLSESVLQDMESSLRKKCEQLLTEMIHQRDVSRLIVAGNCTSKTDFQWLYHLRFYWNPKESTLMQNLCIKMANASFFYGFEYLGISERLVQTPLTDRCYLTLTQALHFRMGANPFGPAGTGKTESVKMLGAQLGRFVLVFNCDSAFDYAAMGRIFAGLCQVGAWGCFDEFNRLEERILSAVSQQILTIQRGLMLQKESIELLGNSCKLHKDVGIFVTLNPGYAGRSNLPDNLKQLFRAVAMVIPDRKIIAQVMLFSQGIVTAEELAGKIVLLFTLCEEQLTTQSHYDFGLRALKSVLIGAGDLKRKALTEKSLSNDNNASSSYMSKIEIDVLITSACDSILPKLVAEDIPLFNSLLQAVFPLSELPKINDAILLEAIKVICEEDSLEVSDDWIEKVLQLKQVLDMRHGVMMVGPSGTGKTTAWRTLLKALSKVDGVKGNYYVIDPKSIKKDKLYGTLDHNTLEWTDGVFTKLLRKVSESASHRGVTRRSWIIFDGDVDPEWAENLNSVLDDNRVLTLPSGDRLKLPNNVRIMMEVDTLKYATLATVSRCGMVWFPSSTVPLDILFKHHLKKLRKETIQLSDGSTFGITSGNNGTEIQKNTLNGFIECISPLFTTSTDLVGIALTYSLNQKHVMDVTTGQLISTLYSLLLRGITIAVEYNELNSDFPMSDSHMDLFATKWLLYSLLWAFGGSLTWDRRSLLSDELTQHSNIEIPYSKHLIDLQVNVSDGSWSEWSTLVPKMEIESNRVIDSDVVITTTDTVRHCEVLLAWLQSHKPLILCGPPGSGKTMTLTSVLESMPDLILASLNFSSGTTPDLILKTFAQYCEIVDSPDGLIMQPTRQSYRESQWLVVFCDEINLPDVDIYGTQTVIMFLRQLTEQGGFWNNDCKWVKLSKIQFVGACNPPEDAGRKPISPRFLRHASLLLVDYPAEVSLKQIYRCFNHALLKLHPNLKGSIDPLNDSMVQFYLANQSRFTPDIAPQYIYSPRELSRWVRAMYEAMEPLEAMTTEELVRLWGHEALRLFQDRLMTIEAKEWCYDELIKVACQYFAGIDINQCLMKPMLYSSWLKKSYQSTDKDEIREYIGARLKIFYEEELDVPLVLFDDVIEHILRIDNVLRHPMGHLLLVGESGVGKTVLSRFVSWMNGLSVFQIKANNKYTIEQFDDDLRILLRRVGVDGEKVCFIFDEGNALSSAFLERMNALLASGEVPGLFEGDERIQLMSACRENFRQKESKGGLLMDSEDEIWRRFTKIIQKNLHVVFTMNPASSDFQNRCTTSPALFNRCVVDWFGTWSQSALAQVGHEFTLQLDTGYTEYSPTGGSEIFAMVMETLQGEEWGLREAVVAALVSIHNSVKTVTLKLAKLTGRQHYLSPRDYLDLIKKFVSTEQEKRDRLEDLQIHIRTGLQKILETQDQVGTLRIEMVSKAEVLGIKDTESNQKLSQMVELQNEAEQRKVVAEQLTLELQKQNEEIRIRRESVEQELSEAEPSLLAAKQSVQNIRKAQLDEVRALARPPNAVRLTMEMVSLMIGEKNLEWIEIRKVIRRDDFIATIVNFNPLTLTSKQVKSVAEDYLALSELDYASVDRASKACGPLYVWVESQIKYATILRRVKPLRDEVTELQEKSSNLEIQQKETIQQVDELENSIKQYKLEYATAIRDTETIRSEMDIVTRKVGRAEALLLSLEEEKDRWQTTSISFDNQMSTLIGDCLISAAFLTYAGIFDHRIRKNLKNEWSESLDTLGIPYRADLEIIGYLSNPSEQMVWKGYGLPGDELAMQNAILLERLNRYPLIIDPSGQATNFVIQKYSNRKIVQTSFLDTNFLKILASAIRFGTALLVSDVESIDPILNPVLNKELQKTGGRTLIRLGNEDIDFSPKFMIILSTRNPLAHFAPDLCSRVTMVNFTVTPASLEAQTLSAILKSERPDVDRRRTEVLRLQGEQNVKLRELEEALLNKISAVQGAILDDDSVINTLEVIKSEAAELNREVMKTQEIMNEVRIISNIYEPLAFAMSSVYFSLENLSDISFLYQFSLKFFMDIVNAILISKLGNNNNNSKSINIDIKESKIRVQSLTNSFYSEISRKVLRGLKFDDKLMFVVRLAQISTNGQEKKELNDTELDFFFRGSIVVEASHVILQKFKTSITGRELDDIIARQLLSLSLLPVFKDILNLISISNESQDKWVNFLFGNEPENNIPIDWNNQSEQFSIERISLLNVLLVKTLRPERTLYALESYVSNVFGEEFKWREHCKLDLKYLVENDSKANTPMMICSEQGQDASGKIDSLATNMNKILLQVAMGSTEGYTEADKSIAQASKNGSWVLLRNVHLCPDWLSLLEKKIHGWMVHDNFRLFLTCDINPNLPSALLRVSDVIVSEASTGVKANIQRFYGNIPASRIDRQPAERARLYGLLAWFNAIVQERLRYTPLGWTKRYEFNEADANCALDVIDQWVDELAGPRAHINPIDLPWQALRTLLSQSLYGGRIDHLFDQSALDSFIEQIFNANSYSSLAVLAHDHAGVPLLTLPDGLNRVAFEKWILELPDSNSPAWLGLPITAESHLQTLLGQKMLSKLTILQGVLDDNYNGDSNNDNTKTQLTGMKETIDKWLTILPDINILPLLNSESTCDALSTPLQRCLAREISKGLEVLKLVLDNLNAVKLYCNHEIKVTNDLRDIIDCFIKGIIPNKWRIEYVVINDVPVGNWIRDLSMRLKVLESYQVIINSTSVSSKIIYNIGKMFSPESFITATRQYTAQVNKWSLEELELYLDIGCDTIDSVQDTIIEGLVLQGAKWDNSKIILSDDLKCHLPLSRLRWKLRNNIMDKNYVQFPIYLNDARSNLLVEVFVLIPKDEILTHIWSQRGVSFVMQQLV